MQTCIKVLLGYILNKGYCKSETICLKTLFQRNKKKKVGYEPEGLFCGKKNIMRIEVEYLTLRKKHKFENSEQRKEQNHENKDKKSSKRSLNI